MYTCTWCYQKIKYFLFNKHLLVCIGDEVIEWNSRSLQGKSYQEVYDIIAESKQETQVELIVSRSMKDRRAAQASWRHSHTSTLQSRGNRSTDQKVKCVRLKKRNLYFWLTFLHSNSIQF